MKSEEKKKLFLIITGFIIVLSFAISFYWMEVAEFSATFVEYSKTIYNNKNYDYSKSDINIANNTEDFRENPANAFVYVFGTIVLLLLIVALRFRQLLGTTVILLIIYIMSAFYSIMGFILTPISNLVTIAIFAPLIIIYHRRIINGIVLISAIITIIGIAFYFKQAACFILLLPTAHLIAIRANNALKSRYLNKSERLSVNLSQKQKNQIRKSTFYTVTWWEVLEPELDEMLNSWYTTLESVSPLDGDSILSIQHNEEIDFDLHDYKYENSVLSYQQPYEIDQIIKELQLKDKLFSRSKFLDRFQILYKKIVSATYNQSIESIQAMVSDALYEQLKSKINEQKTAGIKFTCNKCDITELKIARLVLSEDYDEIHVKVSASIQENAVDLATGKSLSYNQDEVSEAIEIWTFIRRPTAQTFEKPGLMESNCPNCGAPIQIGQATVCPSCHSYLRSGTYDWVLSQITQAGEWRYANPDIIPGWNDLKKTDKHLCIQHIEDKAAVIFWILKEIERTRNTEPLLRFAQRECYDLLKKFKFCSNKNYICYENISIGSVSLRAIKQEEEYTDIYLLILWNAVKVEFENNERLPSVHRIIEPHRDVIVLTRKNDVTTKIDNTLSSAHCPNCGGSLNSSFDVKCQYCGTILNDGSEWILEKITNENDLEYRELTQKSETMLTFAIEQKKIKEKKIKQDLEKELQISTARDLVAASAQIMLANGYIADSEQETYDNLCKNCCVSKEEGQRILNDIKDGKLKVEFSKDKKGKAAKMILDVAIEMAYADGILHPNQRKFILEFAKQMGFVNIDIDFLIKKYESKLAIQKIRDEKESVRLKAREELNEHYKRAQEKNKQ